MMRITDTEGSDGMVTVRVEGRLTRATIAELQGACERHMTAAGVVVDLSGVRFADGSGVRGLRDLERHGALVRGASGFVRQLLGEQPAADSEPTGEAALVARLQAGDRPAFEQLVRTYGGRLLAVARRLLGNDADARDAVQEAFLSALKGIASFGGSARLSTWLHRIVVNAALMKMRSRRRKREDSIDDLLPAFDDEGRRADPTAGWQTSSEVLLQRRETRLMVRRCIERLPEAYRTVLLLRDIEELDTEEAGATLGISPNAAKVRLHRARQALRTLLACELGSDALPVRRVS